MLQEEYQLKVTLLDVAPSVWRRLLVRHSVSLAKLHEILQDVMGWDNKHLYFFQVGDRAFEAPHPEAAGENARRCSLGSLGLKAGDRFLYLYDFGDDWHHDLTVEVPVGGLREPDYATCLDGENACPPEDCGGPHGYAQLLQALVRPDDPTFRERLEWLEPGFRPDVFDLRATNRVLRLVHRRKGAV